MRKTPGFGTPHDEGRRHPACCGSSQPCLPSPPSQLTGTPACPGCRPRGGSAPGPPGPSSGGAPPGCAPAGWGCVAWQWAACRTGATAQCRMHQACRGVRRIQAPARSPAMHWLPGTRRQPGAAQRTCSSCVSWRRTPASGSAPCHSAGGAPPTWRQRRPCCCRSPSAHGQQRTQVHSDRGSCTRRRHCACSDASPSLGMPR